MYSKCELAPQPTQRPSTAPTPPLNSLVLTTSLCFHGFRAQEGLEFGLTLQGHPLTEPARDLLNLPATCGAEPGPGWTPPAPGDGPSDGKTELDFHFLCVQEPDKNECACSAGYGHAGVRGNWASLKNRPRSCLKFFHNLPESLPTFQKDYSWREL